MNIWHDISPELITPQQFTAVIEIPMGSKKKYEMDKRTGLLRLDRILHTSAHYPANYGFIPRTYADDSDPLDVLVLCSESLDPLVMVDCIPIGCIRMIDEDSYDEKIIAIAREDPTWNFYQDLADLPPHIAQEIRHFFEIYKQLEHKHTTVLDTLPRDEAIQIVSSCMDRYQIHFCGKRPGHPSARAQELSKQLTP
ncbi:MAG: inorganic diphosphatase [Butyricicoccus pullicaecorum]|nr:inorganic diphosphatase [Butyricicoccus pullicaecorum]